MVSFLVSSFLASIPSKPQFQNPTTLWNYKFLSGKIRKTLINTTKMYYFKMFTYKIKFRHNIRLNTFRAIHTRKKARFKASTRESKWSRTSRTASKASTIVVIQGVSFRIVYFETVAVTKLLHILITKYDFYMAKSWSFWYLFLLFQKRFQRGLNCAMKM